MQGRSEAAERVLADAVALAEAGAFCVLMEMVTAEVARTAWMRPWARCRLSASVRRT